MKCAWIVAVVVAVVGANACRAQEGVDKAKATAFDARMFGGPLGKKTYACFVRRYDASHLAQYPKQKVSAMKLLVTSENAPEDKTVNHSFRLGFKYRHRPGNFDSSGFCNHVVAEKSGNEIRLGCGIDCEGGGIEVAMSKDDKSTLIRLERIRIWERNKAGEDAGNDLVAGANDKIFLRAFHSSSANPDLSGGLVNSPGPESSSPRAATS